jgi:Ca2+-binding RTX toxin-like protein
MWTRSQLAFLAGTGTSGSGTITGTSGNDVFDNRGGANTIDGGGGYDTYLYRQGYGALTIENSTPGGTQAQGEIDFGSGITEQNLWFGQVGNDLIARVLGSIDTVDIKGWFGGNLSAPVAELKAFDGLKLDSQVDQLVSVMAGYQAANPTFNPMTAAAMPNDSSLRSALAAAWHS